MSPKELRAAIRELLTSHPAVSVSTSGHAAHADRYMATNGEPIAFEPDRVRFQNIWVRADSVDAAVLADIESRAYRNADFGTSKPNHNLFGEPAFKDAELLCFKVTTLGQAKRVITEVIRGGSR